MVGFPHIRYIDQPTLPVRNGDQTWLDEKVKAIFSCCLAANNKIE